ncbi:MAG: hypothetical protein IPH49_14435 [Ignavibacteria bacterium]|nr:hypothetical protein [Ignavibacteria bacterium]
MLLWYSARAHAETDRTGSRIAFEQCFSVLPIVLHRETRESLPKTVKTSLPVWLSRHPLAPLTMADRAYSPVPFTKEALRFGGAYGALHFDQTTVCANLDWKRRIEAHLKKRPMKSGYAQAVPSSSAGGSPNRKH